MRDIIAKHDFKDISNVTLANDDEKLAVSTSSLPPASSGGAVSVQVSLIGGGALLSTRLMSKIFNPASDGGAVSTSSLPPSSSGGTVSVLVSLKGEALLPTRLISKIFNILDTP